MSKVYVVIRASYSDQEIVGVFKEEVVADNCATLLRNSVRFSSEGARVEEFEVNEFHYLPTDRTTWFVEINIDYEMITTIRNNDNPILHSPDPVVHLPSGLGVIFIELWAKDLNHAEKIAWDAFYKWKASQ